MTGQLSKLSCLKTHQWGQQKLPYVGFNLENLANFNWQEMLFTVTFTESMHLVTPMFITGYKSSVITDEPDSET